MNPICIDNLSNIEVVIDYEWFLKFLSDFFCLMGFLEYLMFWGILTAQLDYIGAELESSAENSDIMRYEIHSAKFPGLLNMQETFFLEVVELIPKYSKMIIACVFFEDTKCLL